jgi:hypothetical protein
MMDETKLTKLILNHWENHNPKRLAQLKKEGRLEAELMATAERVVDLIHELTIVQKQAHSTAWEIAVHQILQGEPEEEEATSPLQNQSSDPHAISE